MEMLIFIYNIVLIILFCVSTTFAITCYLKSKQFLFLVMGVMFVFYIFDNTVIYMTETIERFARSYDSQLMSIPSFKTVILLVDAICITCIFNLLLKRKMMITQYAGLILMGLLLLFIPMMNAGAKQVWFYYLPCQIYLGWLGISTLWFLKNKSKIDKDSKQYLYLKRILVATIVFAFLILVEDTIVIFNVDVYSDILVRINNRNISEDILSIIYAVFAMSFCYKLLVMSPASARGFFDEQQEAQVSNEINMYETFCYNYELTQREQDILHCVLQSMNNQEISATLFISVGTVKTHIHNIFTKMNVRKRNEAQFLFQKWKEDNVL